MNNHKMPVTDGPIYGNAIMQAPDGEQLCRIDDKRADWYVNHPEDIAYEIVDGDGPRIVRLRFEPSGRAGVHDPFQQGDKRNECAVCGETNGLTRHHILPWSYRKHLPQEVITHCFHDIVPLCVRCHGKYEATVYTYKLLLCVKYDIPYEGTKPEIDIELGKATKAAFAIVRHGAKIPADRLRELQNVVVEYSGCCDDSTLLELTKSENKNTHNNRGKSHGQMIVEKLALDDLQEFYEGWRQHFLDNTNPQFMPDHWSVTRKVNGTSVTTFQKIFNYCLGAMKKITKRT